MANLQNQEAKSYSDKFSKTDMKPTVRGFGGRPLEGFLVVGTTGLVQAFVMGGTKGKVTNTEILGGIRLAYRFIDLAWTKGRININALHYILCYFENLIYRWKYSCYCGHGYSVRSYFILQAHHSKR